MEPSLNSRRRADPGHAGLAESDERLVRHAVDGNRQAFETLVRRHRRGLVSHLYRHTGRRDVALDLAQEVFLKVYLSLASFNSKFRFTTWLYRIASNCAIDHLRKRQPRTCSIHAGPEDERHDEPERALAGTTPTPDEFMRARELQARLEVAIGNLPSDYRQLILLRHRQHCRYDEIARITRLPLGTVKNRIFRAREMLRHELSDILDSET